MLRIGLTGGIAAGKSLVAERFAGLGAVLVDADVLARAAVQPGSDGLDEVVTAFGREILTPQGELDRPALGRLVFADQEARERLNAIVHPRVRARAAALIEAAGQDAIVVEDIPLLVETGQSARFHLVVVVDAPDDLRIRRLVARRGLERGDAQQRIAAQASREDRLREADAILPNDRAIDDLLAATDALWRGRILPYRDNLAAQVPTRSGQQPAAAAGLIGTRGLTRRVAAKLAAALPSGVAHIVPDAPGGGHDDVTSASLRVTAGKVEDVSALAAAVEAAGHPRVEDTVDGGPARESSAHRGADPATEVRIRVAAAAL